MSTFNFIYNPPSNTGPSWSGSDQHGIATSEITYYGLTPSVLESLYPSYNSSAIGCYVANPTPNGPVWTQYNSPAVQITVTASNMSLIGRSDQTVTLSTNQYTNSTSQFQKYSSDLTSTVLNTLSWQWSGNAASIAETGSISAAMNVITSLNDQLTASFNTMWGQFGFNSTPNTLGGQSNSVGLLPQQSAISTLTASQHTYIFRLDFNATLSGSMAEQLSGNITNFQDLPTQMAIYGVPVTYQASLFVTMTQYDNAQITCQAQPQQ